MPLLNVAPNTPEPELRERMAQDPTLVRRPIVVAGEELMVGFNPRRLQDLLG